ncbi:MAG: hypothetical protein ABIH41_00130 [Nanoarchaeota archaeon]
MDDLSCLADIAGLPSARASVTLMDLISGPQGRDVVDHLFDGGVDYLKSMLSSDEVMAAWVDNKDTALDARLGHIAAWVADLDVQRLFEARDARPFTQKYRTPHSVLQAYRILTDTSKGRLPYVQSILQDHVTSTSGAYDIIPLHRESMHRNKGYVRHWGLQPHEDGRAYEIWLDTPYGFALTHNQRPQAIVGFNFFDDALWVMQLQGVRPVKRDTNDSIERRFSARGLYGIDWQRALVEYTAQCAKQWEFGRFVIQRGEDNLWTEPTADGKIHLDPGKAEAIYDATAIRCGMALQDGAYVRSL